MSKLTRHDLSCGGHFPVVAIECANDDGAVLRVGSRQKEPRDHFVKVGHLVLQVQ